ncbi:hypothetical protein ACJX0J_021140, partial [Zea mays]
RFFFFSVWIYDFGDDEPYGADGNGEQGDGLHIEVINECVWLNCPCLKNLDTKKIDFGKMFGLVIIFTVHSMYLAVINNGVMPLKIKIFMWYILKQLLLVGASTICWAIWLSRNDVVFDKSPMKTFMQQAWMELGSIVNFNGMRDHLKREQFVGSTSKKKKITAPNFLYKNLVFFLLENNTIKITHER